MQLLIDIGNTNTVFALAQNDVIVNRWRMLTDHRRSPDEYAAFVSQWFVLQGCAFSDIEAVLVSSVVPETHRAMRNFIGLYLKKEPVFIAREDIPVHIDLDRPEELGMDRLLNALAVQRDHKTPAIVVDFGTATTFDVITAKGDYSGGVIAPGINLSLSALHSAASKLPKISIKVPPAVIAKNTEHAMQSGIFYGYVSLIEGVIARIQNEIGQDATVIATGGLAPLFADHTRIIGHVDEDLTIKGIMEIARLKSK